MTFDQFANQGDTAAWDPETAAATKKAADKIFNPSNEAVDKESEDNEPEDTDVDSDDLDEHPDSDPDDLAG